MKHFIDGLFVGVGALLVGGGIIGIFSGFIAAIVFGPLIRIMIGAWVGWVFGFVFPEIWVMLQSWLSMPVDLQAWQVFAATACIFFKLNIKDGKCDCKKVSDDEQALNDAAPEMLEMLKEIVRDDWVGRSGMKDSVETLIKRAEGDVEDEG